MKRFVDTQVQWPARLARVLKDADKYTAICYYGHETRGRTEIRCEVPAAKYPNLLLANKGHLLWIQATIDAIYAMTIYLRDVNLDFE